MYMETKSGQSVDVASNGKANAALTTGIIGTAGVGLGLLGAMSNRGCGGCGGNGGFLGGLFGGGGGDCGDCGGCNNGSNCKVNRYELAQAQRIASLEAEKYSDNSDLALYNALFAQDKAQTAATNSLFRESFVAIAALDKETAVNKMEIDKNFQLVNQKIDCCCANVDAKIEALATNVACNYIKADKFISACHVTPYPQAANPQPVPTFVCGCNG